jgi:hypothetical protein
MTIMRNTTFAMLLATLPLAGGCQQQSSQHASASASATDGSARAVAGSEAQTTIGKVVQKEILKARKELRNGNLVISGDHNVSFRVGDRKVSTGHSGDDSLPRAEISPKGDLLLDGKVVAVNDAQRRMLLDYREQVIGVAETGMEIGSKGADLAGTAVKEALGSIFGGDSDAVGKRIEAQAEALKQQAKVICKQLPPMLATQQALAASLPEFKPYATMTASDVEDCARDIDHEGAWSTK